MSDFRMLSADVLASPQLTLEDVEQARGAGVTRIVNNRPEGESDDQTPGSRIEEAARAAGIDYVAIPVSPGGFTLEQVEQMGEALRGAQGKVLAYCRTGTRSTLLWALVQAAEGAPLENVAAAAAAAGYDVAPILPLMEQLARDA